MWAAAAAPSGSDAVVAVLLVLLPVLLLEVAEGRAHLLLPLVLLQGAAVLAPLRVAPAVVAAPLAQLVVEPEVPVHLRSRQSFSASTARISPPPVQPTYERAPSTR
jgi:4-amino-4-deoxy-L-arabinose transferase-like glycosyltransferase